MMGESDKLKLLNNHLGAINKEYRDFVEFKRDIKPKSEAIQFFLIYLLIGSTWILFSDQIAIIISKTQEAYQYIQLFKGWFYILVSGIFFGWIVFKRMRLFELAIQELVQEYELLTMADEELIAMDEAIQQQYEEIKQQKNALSVSDERYQLAVEGANDGIWEWDIIQNKYFISQRVAEIIGISKEEIENNPDPYLKHIHPDDVERVKDSIAQYLMEKTGVYEETYRLRKNDGTYVWILSHGKAIWNEDGEAIRVAGSYTNITDQMENQEKLHQLAFYDQLTHLPNREWLTQEIDEMIKMHIDEDYKIAFLYLDIDDFKHINDTIGHAFGDDFIVMIADFLKKEVGEIARISRLGGDEFGIVIYDMQNIEEIKTLAEYLSNHIKKPWKLGEYAFYIGASIGVALYPESGSNASALMQNADTAMFHVKEHGKDDYCLYAPDMRQQTWNYIKMNNLIREGIENNEFSLYYQPQIDVQTEEVVGVEALIRWIHPTEGFISPMDFIPFAEMTGQIYDIGEWVLQTACIKKSEWKSLKYSHIKMAVNLSSKRLTQEGLVEKIKNEIEKYGLSGECLELEITETAVMDDLERAIHVLHEIRALGVTIALDDFGTGYSSLTYLQKLPIDVLKVDREFINNITKENEESHIFKFVTQVAHTLGLKVIAEGVETKEQLEFLQKNGCDIAQGYYFSKPMPCDEINAVISQIDSHKL